MFGVYFIASILIGISVGGRQRDLKTFLLAGNQAHWFVLGVSIIAGLFSGISFLGAPAETFNHNLIYLWGAVGYLIATPLTSFVFLPFFHGQNFYTAYEYLEHRFDRRLRRLSSATFIFRASLWLALALYAPALIISEMMGIPLWISIVVTGLCTTFYTCVGGMKAVLYTDMMQFGVMILGIAVIFGVAVWRTPGGWEGAWAIAEAGGRTRFFDFSFDPTVRMTVWGAAFGGIFTSLVQLVTDQISVQRYLAAASLGEARKALWLKFALTVPLMALFYLTGLILYAFYQSHPGMLEGLTAPDRLLAHFVNLQLPSPLPGLIVAALLAATMSTISAGINSLTTATMMDFIIDETRPNTSEAGKVRNARIWTFFFGALATGLGLFIGRLGTLIEASVKISGLLGGPLLGVFFLGILSRRANSIGTLIGLVSGMLTVFIVTFCTPISFMWYAAIGCITTCLVGFVASLASAPPDDRQKGFSFMGRRSVAREGEPQAAVLSDSPSR